MNRPSRSLVIVATYNELDNLPKLVDEIFRELPTTDILIVDDNSPDGTGRWCDDYSARDGRLSCLHRASKQGLGAAVLAGLAHAVGQDYDLAINMDADFSHPPAALPRLVAALESDSSPAVDVIIGSRYIAGGGIENWTWRRHCLSQAVNLYSRWILRIPARDCSGGFRGFRVSFLKRFDASVIRSRGYAFFEEQLWRLHRAGARIAETPITFVNRQAGESKADLREMLSSALFLLRLGIETWR